MEKRLAWLWFDCKCKGEKFVTKYFCWHSTSHLYWYLHMYLYFYFYLYLDLEPNKIARAKLKICSHTRSVKLFADIQFHSSDFAPAFSVGESEMDWRLKLRYPEGRNQNTLKVEIKILKSCKITEYEIWLSWPLTAVAMIHFQLIL